MESSQSAANAYHEYPKPGKFDIVPTKKMETQQDLALAYSPGVAEPCLEIAKDPELAYNYTNKGNLVACISNGTAVLGIGNIGALASKPVMEGKSVLFKKFAGVNSVDLCIDCPDPEKLVDVVSYLAPSFGGINLEDIKGPDCFYVEDELKKKMPIPVFHDDQHGTAIVCLAGLINSLKQSGKKIEDCKIVCNGAGAAGIACIKLIKEYGAKAENVWVCDTKGVIYQGRTEGMNKFKESLATTAVTEKTSLVDACKDADVLIGVSAKGAFTEEVLKNLAKDPIIFAMANPDPEVLPEVAKQLRPDAIIATGRSDYPNQINNVLCFPFLFRATLDCRAKEINEAMKLAAAKTLAELAQQPVVEEVKKTYSHRTFDDPKEYVIPTPYDPRLLTTLPPAVAKAAADSGVAKTPIQDYDKYVEQLK